MSSGYSMRSRRRRGSMPKQLLVIDDEDDIREVVKLSLQLTEGWTVMTANGGGTGTGLALSMKPGALLLDVMMPDMDGPCTPRALPEQRATELTPGIFLTAKVQAAECQKPMPTGVR